MAFSLVNDARFQVNKKEVERISFTIRDYDVVNTNALYLTKGPRSVKDSTSSLRPLLLSSVQPER
jgi:hypothetical protein